MKRMLFSVVQPAMLAAVLMFWWMAPASWIDNPFTVTAVSILTLSFIQMLEFVNERHVGWRIYRLEFLTDLFYAVLFFGVIAGVEDSYAETPLASVKHALGISTDWALH
jgi:hypothetical protein